MRFIANNHEFVKRRGKSIEVITLVLMAIDTNRKYWLMKKNISGIN